MATPSLFILSYVPFMAYTRLILHVMWHYWLSQWYNKYTYTATNNRRLILKIFVRLQLGNINKGIRKQLFHLVGPLFK